MRVVYMGTPDFAVGPLEAIIKAGHEVVMVVTQPDRQKGRGKEIQFSPVKEAAVRHNIPVYQPEKIRREEAVAKLEECGADIFVVAAFGQILTSEILGMPRYGCVNIHASLLPKYRGAAPIQWAVIDGEEKSGVTIMQMDEGIDTGDILLQKELVLDKKETGASLFERLAELGCLAIVEAMELIENGSITRTPQDHDASTYAKMLTKELGRINWGDSAVVIERLIRGLNSWPSAYTSLNGKNLKIWDAEVVDIKGEAGVISEVTKDSFTVGCKEGSLAVTELQLEGKKRMNVHDFLLGYKLECGTVLGR